MLVGKDRRLSCQEGGSGLGSTDSSNSATRSKVGNTSREARAEALLAGPCLLRMIQVGSEDDDRHQPR